MATSSYQRLRVENESLAKAFIELARKEGYSDDEIIKALREHGLVQEVHTASSAISKALQGGVGILGDGNASGSSGPLSYHRIQKIRDPEYSPGDTAITGAIAKALQGESVTLD